MDNSEDNDNTATSRFRNVVMSARRKYLGHISLKDMNIKKILSPWASYDSRFWNKIFLVSCVIGVSIDPFFLYIPIINEDNKCLEMDQTLKILALIFRSVTDFPYLLHLIFRLTSALSMAKLFGASIYIGFPWFYLLIDILAILPIPQIFGAIWYFHAIFRETACWHIACKSYPGCIPSPFDCRGNINPMKNLTYLNEFCPVDPPNSTVFNFGIFTDAIESRILQETDFLRKFSHSFWWGLKNLSSFGQNLETSRNIAENFFAVLISILGLLLFLYLIGNLQTDMQLATTKSEETMKKLSIKQPEIESHLSDIGHLSEKKKKVIMRYLQGIIKDDKDFDMKYLLSLLPEHIDAQQNYEITFTEWISKLKDAKTHEKNTAEQKVKSWISKNEIPVDLRKKIMRYVRLRLQEGKDVDVGIKNVLPILPSRLEVAVKRHLCFPILRKVSMLQNMEEIVYKTICNFLKPMTFAQNSYIIRKGAPLDLMLFITQGIVWTFGSSTSPMERLQKGDYYGKELIEWQLNSTSYWEFPISTANLKSHSKVEAFALMAMDLELVFSHCWSKFSQRYPTLESMPKGLKSFLAVSLQQKFRHNIKRRRARQHNQAPPNDLSVVLMRY